jgi:drug/metabolite transporter (DMT)-like permease
MAILFLGESLTPQQWLGAALFAVNVLLIRRDTGLQIADEDTWWDTLFPEDKASGT